MIRLTPHFHLDEFMNREKEFHRPGEDSERWIEERYFPLARNLEALRLALGYGPVIVTSGFRTLAQQRNINPRVTNSLHLEGLAADFFVRRIDRGLVPHEEVWRMINLLVAVGKMENGGVGLYRGHVHYDLRVRHGWEPKRWVDPGVTNSRLTPHPELGHGDPVA